MIYGQPKITLILSKKMLDQTKLVIKVEVTKKAINKIVDLIK